MNILQDKDGNFSSMRTMMMSIIAPIMAKHSIALAQAEEMLDMPLNTVILLIAIFLAKALQSYFENKGISTVEIMKEFKQFKKDHAKDIQTAKKIIAAGKR